MMRASGSYGRLTTSAELVHNAWKAGLAVPTFNVPHLPMIEPIIRALVDYDAFAFVGTAPAEWPMQKRGGLKEVYAAFCEVAQREYVRIHLDHVVTTAEPAAQPWQEIIAAAAGNGYHSVMIDASALSLEENIRVTREAVELAHAAGIACEAELGPADFEAVPANATYAEKLASGVALTDPEAAARFVSETGCDWLAVSVGNIHGPMQPAADERPRVSLDIERVARISAATKIPLALHGLRGIGDRDLHLAIRAGVAKINVTDTVRRLYEEGVRDTGSVPAAQEMLFEQVATLLLEYFAVSGARPTVLGDSG